MTPDITNEVKKPVRCRRAHLQSQLLKVRSRHTRASPHPVGVGQDDAAEAIIKMPNASSNDTGQHDETLPAPVIYMVCRRRPSSSGRHEEINNVEEQYNKKS